MTRINCSFYGAEGEKLNENVAMLASEVCPACKMDHVARINGDVKPCKRCGNDGFLTNPIKFIPDAMSCASNDYKLGTWLKITKLDKSKTPCIIREPIIVMVTDRMASWLNSENGKYKWVCKCCHDKFNDGDAIHSCCASDNVPVNRVLTRDIDLSRGAFEKLANLSVGVLTAEVEVL